MLLNVGESLWMQTYKCVFIVSECARAVCVCVCTCMLLCLSQTVLDDEGLEASMPSAGDRTAYHPDLYQCWTNRIILGSFVIKQVTILTQ